MQNQPPQKAISQKRLADLAREIDEQIQAEKPTAWQCPDELTTEEVRELRRAEAALRNLHQLRDSHFGQDGLPVAPHTENQGKPDIDEEATVLDEEQTIVDEGEG